MGSKFSADNVVTTTTTSTPLYRNECDVITLLNMVIECQVLKNPSSPSSCDGILQINVSGGTSPYFISWADSSSVSFTRNNLCVGNYTATVSDYYNDFNLTTTCVVTANTNPCNCYALVTTNTDTGTEFNYTDCFGVEKNITITFGEAFLQPVFVCAQTVPIPSDLKGSVTLAGSCTGNNTENCTLPEECYCYELTKIPIITSENEIYEELILEADAPTSFLYWSCDGSRVIENHTNGTYYICSKTEPATTNTNFTITKLDLCVDGLCPTTCKCMVVTNLDITTTTITYLNCDGDLVEDIPLYGLEAKGFCGGYLTSPGNIKIYYFESECVPTGEGGMMECPELTCGTLGCNCITFTSSSVGGDIEWFDCFGGYYQRTMGEYEVLQVCGLEASTTSEDIVITIVSEGCLFSEKEGCECVTTTTIPPIMLPKQIYTIVIENLDVKYIVNNPSCGCDGSIILVASNGYAPYSYSINNGTSYQLSPIFTSLCSGLYTISVLDISGNSKSLQINLNEPNPPVPYIISLDRNTKVVADNGIIKTEVTTVSISVTPQLPDGAYISFNLSHTNSFNVSPDFSVASVVTNTQLLKNTLPIFVDVSDTSTGSTVNTYPGCQDQFVYLTTLTEGWTNLQINSTDNYEISTTTSVTQNSSANCYYENVVDSYFVSNLKIYNCSCCKVINN